MVHPFSYPIPLRWTQPPPAIEGVRVGVRITLIPERFRIVAPFRDGTAPCATENHVIPAFLEMVFDQPLDVMKLRLN
jgi:hypothetical protein